jgi:hypothetical protein
MRGQKKKSAASCTGCVFEQQMIFTGVRQRIYPIGQQVGGGKWAMKVFNPNTPVDPSTKQEDQALWW